jgi:hypothetical protein
MTEQAEQITPRWHLAEVMDLLVPIEGKEHAPAAAWEASEHLRAALRGHQIAKEQHAAAAALEQAKAVDAAADRHAILANSRMATPTQATPKAEAALALADRRLVAAQAEVHDAHINVANQILKHFDDWSTSVESGRNDIRTDITAALDHVSALFTKLSTSDRIVYGLSRFPHYPRGGSLVTVSFGEQSPKWRRFEEDRRAEELQKLRYAIEQGHNSASMVPRDVNALLAALTTIANPVERIQVTV